MSKSISAIGNAAEVVSFALVANASAGVLGSWQNTTGNTVLVLQRGIVVDSTSTGSATVDMGVASTVATNDTLIDGQALNGLSAGAVVRTAGTNGGDVVRVPNGHYVTAFGSADTTGFAGNAYLLITEL